MAAPEPLRIRISLRPSRATDPLADDREVLDMITGRPEDEDFIYLDVDGGDEPADAAWSPKARVVIKRPGEESIRPKRNKRRKVVDSCLANASAKLSSQESSQEEDDDENVQKDVQEETKQSPSSPETSHGAESRRRRRRNGGTSATRTRTRKQVQRKKELKKGHRTAKQRLAQAIGLWKGVRS